MENLSEIKAKFSLWKKQISDEKNTKEKIDHIVKKKVDRAPWFWEYSESELEEEMKKRLAHLEKSSDFPHAGDKGEHGVCRQIWILWRRLFRKLSKIFPVFFQGDALNKEMASFFTVQYLLMQKMKERINSVEDLFRQLRRDQKDLADEMEILLKRYKKSQRDISDESSS